MNILVINGSPKGKRSNTVKLTEAFLAGLNHNSDNEVRRLDVCQMNIGSCKGCFSCWKATPGSCVIKDDMAEVLESIIWADTIIYSFPLYYFSVPGSLKNLIDRQLPMVLPFMEERTDGVGSGSHNYRYDIKEKRFVLISTCGFYSAAGNYDSVKMMFDHICGKSNYETIFCGQGELFAIKALGDRTGEYLKSVEAAGEEYASGEISEKTRAILSELLFPKETFETMADASWGVSRETGTKEDESAVFTRQMAALYNKNSYDGKDRVLEICYTDLGKTYQILLGKDGSKVLTDGSLKYTTRIDTPWDVWQKVSKKEMRGDEALAKHLYTVSGDFSLMIDWNKYFGGEKKSAGVQVKQPSISSAKKSPKMTTMLIAWIALWVGVSIDAEIGAIIALGVCACLPLIMMKHELIIYDVISFASVSLLAIFSFFTGRGDLSMIFGYLAFGLIWLSSCLTKEPLCAAYVKYNYGGNDSLKNPIFMKTNYILAAAWGVLYIAISIWTFILSGHIPSLILIIINQSMPIIMGIFTAWFQNWYPARVASGK